MAIRCHVTVIGKQGENVSSLHPWTVNYQFGATTALDSTACLAVANAIMTALAANADVKAILTTKCAIHNIRVAFHSPDTGPETSAAESTAATFGGTSNLSTVPQAAVVATLRTGIPGRSYRGRLYWPAGVMQPDASGGYVASPTLLNDGVQAIAQECAIAAANAGSNLAWYVWSKTKGVGTPVSQVSVGNRVDTQRRRVEADELYTNFPVS